MFHSSNFESDTQGYECNFQAKTRTCGWWVYLFGQDSLAHRVRAMAQGSRQRTGQEFYVGSTSGSRTPTCIRSPFWATLETATRFLVYLEDMCRRKKGRCWTPRTKAEASSTFGCSHQAFLRESCSSMNSKLCKLSWCLSILVWNSKRMFRYWDATLLFPPNFWRLFSIVYF